MPSKEEKEAEKKRKLEIKEKEAEVKSEKKVIDGDDACFCGFMSLQVVDSDGLQKMNKGSAIGGVLHIEKEGGKVKLVSKHSLNPLYYLEIQRDAALYLFGEIWYGEQKRTPLNGIGRVIPKSCKALIDSMEKAGSDSFELDVELPFLSNHVDRLGKLIVKTKEQKFVTKVVEVTLELSEADWTAWKEYRLKFWKVSKAWGAGWGGGVTPDKDDDDDEEKKDKKEKDGE